VIPIRTQLAEKTNTKQKSIPRYETGASLPSIETFPPFYLLKGAIPAIIPELFDGFNKIYPI
jgi:hypothetical protein